MMGYQRNNQHKLFISGFNLEERVRHSHILRKILQKVDFNFIYEEVKDTYGENGNVSVPPPVILKLMLFLILYNVLREQLIEKAGKEKEELERDMNDILNREWEKVKEEIREEWEK